MTELQNAQGRLAGQSTAASTTLRGFSTARLVLGTAAIQRLSKGSYQVTGGV
jgi:hypothetical protein